MDSFTCEICARQYPESLLNRHHKTPQALGGPDTPENLADLCSGCHQSLHSVAFILANPKRREELEPTVSSLFPNQPEPRRKLLFLAGLVAKEMGLRREIRRDPTEEVRIVVSLPTKYVQLLRLAGYDLQNQRGPSGVARVIRACVADFLSRKFPTQRADIQTLFKPKK